MCIIYSSLFATKVDKTTIQ